MKIKSFFISALMMLTCASATAESSEALNLRDITNGVYSPQYIYGVNPMNDGETYTQLSPDHKRIIRRSFKTGKEVGVGRRERSWSREVAGH